jgi:hypothetical protein
VPLGWMTDDGPRMGAAVAAAARSSRPTCAAPPKVAEVLPILYLRGLFTDDFKDALGALLDADVSSLSPTSITRLAFLSAGCTPGVLLATVVEAQPWHSPSVALPSPWTVERVDGVRS